MRNQPCQCGSGKKYKKCCLRLQEKLSAAAEKSMGTRGWATTLAYSYISEERKSFQELVDLLASQPKWDTIALLCRLNILVNHPDIRWRDFQYWAVNQFLSGPIQVRARMALDKLKNMALVSEQQILLLIRLLLYKNTEPIKDGRVDPKILGSCLLIANDHIDLPETWGKERNPEVLRSLVVRNQLFNWNDDLKTAIARSTHLIEVVGQSLKEKSENYIDLPAEFELISGIKFKRYMAFMFGLWTKWFNAEANINKLESIDPQTYLGQTSATEQETVRVFQTCSLPHDEYVSQIQKEIVDIERCHYDVLTFVNHPLIKFGEKDCWPISIELLSRKIGHTLYWDLFDGIKDRGGDEGRLKFTRFFGEVFEEYVTEHLLRQAFPAGERGVREKGKKRGHGPEIDYFIAEGDSAVALEIKTSRLNLQTCKTGSLDLLSKDLQKTVIEPAEQLNAGVAAWRQNKMESAIDPQKVKEVWPVIITFYPFPQEWLVWDEIRKQLDARGILSRESFKPLTIINVCELELFLGLLQNQGFANILRMKNEHAEDRVWPFRLFVNTRIKSDIPYHPTVQKRFDEVMDMVEAEMFGISRAGSVNQVLAQEISV